VGRIPQKYISALLSERSLRSVGVDGVVIVLLEVEGPGRDRRRPPVCPRGPGYTTDAVGTQSD